MTVSSVSGTTGTSSTSSTADSTGSSSSTTASGLQTTFLKLLVAQLQNQDPTNPLDSSQMTSQLAQINTVSGISTLNTTLQSVQTQLTATQQLQASALIGKNVFAPGTTVPVTSGTASAAGVQLSAAASDVQVTFKNSSGTTVRTIDLGAESAGVSTVSWDGKDNNGTTVADGNYTMSVTATAAASTTGSSTATTVTATPLTMSAVTSVVQQSGGAVGVTLANGSTTALSNVAQVF